MQAVLGLTPGASRTSRIAELIGKEKFGRLENGEQNILYMNSAAARGECSSTTAPRLIASIAAGGSA